jgi:4-alpha-glucanotransferase
VSEAVRFLFGVHNHQPSGNFESVIRDATRDAYHPFLEAVRAVPGVVLTVHCSGGLLAFLREKARPTFDLLGRLASEGRVELLTGGFYEPILAMLPDEDKIGQIEALSEFLRSNFGVRPRGMWLAERVWEPQLPKVLRAAGVEFVVVDDAHFALAGLEPEALGGYYRTEEQGASLAVFPISQRLRYLVPFGEPAETVRYLGERHGAGAVTLFDDGEKFGVWPGTRRLVYEEGWLARFFDALAGAPAIRMSTFSSCLDAMPPAGRVYLPTASYFEMGEWALPAARGEELEEARQRLSALPDGERLARLLRGGFWRNFLVKYPEMGDAYWRMLRLSARVREALERRPDDPRLGAAREDLWRAQGNDAYWHGVFGGAYLPHLRRAAVSALLAAERRLDETVGAPPLSWIRDDLDGDGHSEVAVRTRELAVTLRPDAGGTVTELAFRPHDLDLAGVFTRRREMYHERVKESVVAPAAGEVKTIHGAPEAKETGLAALLEYDVFRRASLLDGLFPSGPPPDPLSPWAGALVAVGERALSCEIVERAGEVEIVLALPRLDGLPLGVEKRVRIGATGAGLRSRHRLTWGGSEPLQGRWATQLNLTLTAGDAPGRYYRLPGSPSLGSRGAISHAKALTLVDEWVGCEVDLAWSEPGDAGWAPIETVSLSEAGFERIYQGSAVLVSWPVRLAPGASWEVELRIVPRAIPRVS